MVPRSKGGAKEDVEQGEEDQHLEFERPPPPGAAAAPPGAAAAPTLAADDAGWKSLFKEADNLALAGEWQQAYIKINESMESFETSWNLSMFESMGRSILIQSLRAFRRARQGAIGNGHLGMGSGLMAVDSGQWARRTGQ